MDTSILEKIGLTKNEISVYLALLELGTTTTGPLTKRSGMHSSRVYESLDKLISKGLVSFIVRSNHKHFSAAPPSVLLDIVEEEKKEIKNILPELNQLHKEKQGEENAAIYEGYKGVRSVFDNIIRDIRKGDTIYVLGARKEKESFMSETYFKEYTRRRISKGIKMKMLFNADARQTGKYYAKMKNTEVKYMPKGIMSPTAVNIFGNKVGMLVLSPTPRMFLITSKEVSDSHKEFFKMLWDKSR